MNKICLLIILTTILISCRVNQGDLDLAEKNEIIKELESIAIENLRSWEPPFSEEKLLKPFTNKDDFFVVIDEFQYFWNSGFSLS